MSLSYVDVFAVLWYRAIAHICYTYYIHTYNISQRGKERELVSLRAIV